MDDQSPQAGLTFAPPYDPSNELDPSAAESIPPRFDIRDLRYFQEQEAKRTNVARAALLALIFGMLAANIWMTRQAQSALMTNLNQARLDQVALNEKMTAELSEMRALAELYEARLAAIEAQSARGAPGE